jgi:7-cyano-7-deazaguanine synthase
MLNAERSGVSVCALVSGGLDSCVMLAGLARRYRKVYPVFIRHGLVWEETELRHLRRFLRAASQSSSFIPHPSSLRPLAVLSLPVRDLYGNHWSITGRKVPDAATADEAVYLPGRNLLLLSKAAVFCARHKIGTIAIGSLGHNPFPDAIPRFFREFAEAAGSALNFPLKIIAPFRKLTKEQVIRRGTKLGLPLHLTFSCIAPKRDRPCGRCNKCAERQRAFQEANICDRTNYTSRIPG